jgi:predicted transcriptional regulator
MSARIYSFACERKVEEQTHPDMSAGIAAKVDTMVEMTDTPRGEIPSWTFFTNHGHVLVCIAQNPEVRLAEMARLVGISERAIHRIVHDLIDEGFVVSNKVGRRSVYELRLDRYLRHPLEANHRLRDVFGPLATAK